MKLSTSQAMLHLFDGATPKSQKLYPMTRYPDFVTRDLPCNLALADICWGPHPSLRIQRNVPNSGGHSVLQRPRVRSSASTLGNRDLFAGFDAEENPHDVNDVDLPSCIQCVLVHGRRGELGPRSVNHDESRVIVNFAADSATITAQRVFQTGVGHVVEAEQRKSVEPEDIAPTVHVRVDEVVGAEHVSVAARGTVPNLLRAYGLPGCTLLVSTRPLVQSQGAAYLGTRRAAIGRQGSNVVVAGNEGTHAIFRSSLASAGKKRSTYFMPLPTVTISPGAAQFTDVNLGVDPTDAAAEFSRPLCQVSKGRQSVVDPPL